MHALLAVLAVAAPPVPDACVDCQTSTEFLAVAKARRLHIENIAPRTPQPPSHVEAHAQAYLGVRGLRAWAHAISDEAVRAPGSILARLATLGAPNHEGLCARLEIARTWRAWQRFMVATIDCPDRCCLPAFTFEQPTLDLLLEVETLAREHDLFGPCRDEAQDVLRFLYVVPYPDRQSRPLLEGTAFFTCGFRATEGSATCDRMALRATAALELAEPNRTPWEN